MQSPTSGFKPEVKLVNAVPNLEATGRAHHSVTGRLLNLKPPRLLGTTGSERSIVNLFMLPASRLPLQWRSMLRDSRGSGSGGGASESPSGGGRVSAPGDSESDSQSERAPAPARSG